MPAYYTTITKGRNQCACGGAFTEKTFRKHELTKKHTLYHQRKITRALAYSKTLEEAHNAVRCVPEFITHRPDQDQTYYLRIMSVMCYTKSRLGYKPPVAPRKFAVGEYGKTK